MRGGAFPSEGAGAGTTHAHAPHPAQALSWDPDFLGFAEAAGARWVRNLDTMLGRTQERPGGPKARLQAEARPAPGVELDRPSSFLPQGLGDGGGAKGRNLPTGAGIWGPCRQCAPALGVCACPTPHTCSSLCVGAPPRCCVARGAT